MIWLKSNIDRIRSLIADGTPQSLTYASLEARMTIEEICYDRLRNAHDYISPDDLRKWQPAEVVKTLIAEVDTHAASDVTMSIGKEPSSTADPFTLEEFQKQEYVTVGRQIGFDPKKIGKLWNALGSYLHVHLPKSKNDTVELYGDPKSLRKKLNEVLAEFERLSAGTLIISGFGEEVSFQCECGTTNKRRANLLKAGQIVSCINPKCREKWIIEIKDEEIWFQRKSITINCFACGRAHKFPEHSLLRLETDHEWRFNCVCGETSRVRWRLCYATPPSWQPNSTDAQAVRKSSKNDS